MAEPGGGSFTYAYNEAGHLDNLVNPSDERTTYTYNAAGRVTKTALANQTRATYTYDDAGQLTRLTNLKSDDTVISSFDYSYDKVGNRIGVVEANDERVTWTYDASSQLTHEQRNGGHAYDITHEYDPVGNRLVKIDTATGRTTSTYDVANQLSTSEDATGTTTSTYDNAGNLALGQTPGDQRTTNAWDAMNRRTLSQLPSTQRVTSTYNADGLRVEKQSASETKKFIWDGEAYLTETDENDVRNMLYTSQPTRYGKLISEARGAGAGASTEFFHFDGLGSTANVSNPSETVLETFLYDAFGRLISSNSFEPNFLWVGQLGYYYDKNLTDYYIRARHYDPAIARWLSQDPVLVWLSRYSSLYRYVGNRPLSAVDPSGLAEEWPPPGYVGLELVFPGTKDPLRLDGRKLLCKKRKKLDEEIAEAGANLPPEPERSRRESACQAWIDLVWEGEEVRKCRAILNEFGKECRNIKPICECCESPYTAVYRRSEHEVLVCEQPLSAAFDALQWPNLVESEDPFADLLAALTARAAIVQKYERTLCHELLHARQSKTCKGEGTVYQTGDSCHDGLHMEMQAYYCASGCSFFEGCLQRALYSACPSFCDPEATKEKGGPRPNQGDIDKVYDWASKWMKLGKFCPNPITPPPPPSGGW